jgi:NTP pyrophosphatase (non-canonical NTP hydrolase)
MNLNDYQKQAIKTDLLGNGKTVPVTDPAYIAKILGLVGEAGEVAEKYKKIIRDKEGVVSEVDKQELTKEIGDVLWYVSALAQYLGVSLEDVARANLDKLHSRKLRGTQRGSGDNR